jgi:hypothetical protein
MPDLNTEGSMKGRLKGGDRTLDDAFKTMERFSQWLGTARDPDIWPTLDPMQTAMLYRFLEHIRADVEALMAAGGDDARNVLELFQTMQAEHRE